MYLDELFKRFGIEDSFDKVVLTACSSEILKDMLHFVEDDLKYDFGIEVDTNYGAVDDAVIGETKGSLEYERYRVMQACATADDVQLIRSCWDVQCKGTNIKMGDFFDALLGYLHDHRIETPVYTGDEVSDEVWQKIRFPLIDYGQNGYYIDDDHYDDSNEDYNDEDVDDSEYEDEEDIEDGKYEEDDY